MKCHRTQGQVAVPVFYDIDPSVMRYQKGHFGEVLSATAKKVYVNFDEDWWVNVVSTWRSTLNQAANYLSGWDVPNYRYLNQYFQLSLFFLSGM